MSNTDLSSGDSSVFFVTRLTVVAGVAQCWLVVFGAGVVVSAVLHGAGVVVSAVSCTFRKSQHVGRGRYRGGGKGEEEEERERREESPL